MSKHPHISQRIKKYTKKSSGCWLWQGANSHGYPVLRVNGRNKLVSRLLRSKVKVDEYVCHKCDQPLCIKLSHLFIGTPKDNAIDMGKKGRQFFQRQPQRVWRGENHPRAKLTGAQVLTIKYLLPYRTQEEIAKQFKIDQTTVSLIKTNKLWRHING